MDAKAEPGAVCHLIVVTDPPEGESPAAWLPPPAPAWRLPSVGLASSAGYHDDGEAIRQALAAQWSFDGHVLCHLQARGGRASHHQQLAVAATTRASLPVDWQAVDLEWLIGQSLEPPEHAALLAAWLKSSARDARPPRRAPWAVPGWRPRAEAWITAQVAALGLALAGPITARKVWSISCVLQAPTNGGDFFFKAVPPLFGREPALTDALARRHPGQVPEVVALDAEEGWMLMRALSGTVLSEGVERAVWERAARAYAAIQFDWRTDLDGLRRLGCPERGPLWLAGQIDALLAPLGEALMRLDQPGGLTRQQLAELRALAPRLTAACADWQAAGVPLTLEHGDFHIGNLAANGDQFMIFDWTDGCIAHPFVCLAALLEMAPPDWRAAITQAYLEPWRAIAAPSQIETALRLSRVLGPLHMAMSYDDIHHAAEPLMQWQLDGGGPYFLKQVLENQAFLP